MDRMDTMSLFVAAIDAGSLSGAARISGISLSSVSRHLSGLEERVGTKLLIRTTRTLALTEAGQRYYDKSKRILIEIDEMEAGLHTDAETPVGRLHVAGPTLFGRFFMLPLLAKFAVMHPKIVMDVMLLDRQLNLIEEGIDVAVRIGPMVDSSLIIRKLGALRQIICAAPVYSNNAARRTRLPTCRVTTVSFTARTASARSGRYWMATSPRGCRFRSECALIRSTEWLPPPWRAPDSSTLRLGRSRTSSRQGG